MTAADQIRDLLDRTTPEEAQQLIHELAQQHGISVLALDDSVVQHAMDDAMAPLDEGHRNALTNMNSVLVNAVRHTERDGKTFNEQIQDAIRGVVSTSVDQVFQRTIDDANHRYGVRLWNAEGGVMLMDSWWMDFTETYDWSEAQMGKTLQEILDMNLEDRDELTYDNDVDLNTVMVGYSLLIIDKRFSPDSKIAMILAPNPPRSATGA